MGGGQGLLGGHPGRDGQRAGGCGRWNHPGGRREPGRGVGSWRQQLPGRNRLRHPHPGAAHQTARALRAASVGVPWITAPRTRDLVIAAAAFALPLALPGGYHRHLLVLAGLFVLMALGFDLVLGYLGELSLGHAAFFGIGAYTTALLTRGLHVPFPLDLFLAAGLTGVFGLFIGGLF